MPDVLTARKHKIQLIGYDVEQDIKQRRFIANLTAAEAEMLQEILFSPLRISLKKLMRSLDQPAGQLLDQIHRLQKIGLLDFDGNDTLVVHKEMRRSFELLIERLAPHFKPDIEFVQKIIKHIPVALLFTWYLIPRTSNNIFESLIEKYLCTPTIYARHLEDLKTYDPVVCALLERLGQGRVRASDLALQLGIEGWRCNEIVLFLEFHFAAFFTYERVGDAWIEWISPLHEWHEYLSLIAKRRPPAIESEKSIVPRTSSEFAWIEAHGADRLAALGADASMIAHWNKGSNEQKVLFLYRYPGNHLAYRETWPAYVKNDKALRSIEPALRYVAHGKWVFLSDFLQTIMTPITNEAAVTLKKEGAHWHYVLPTYSDTELAFVQACIEEWFFELGMVMLGSFDGRVCFRVTTFGQRFFEE
ncbi:MAG: hypothetical protein RL235_695 [Chlamydiota bacterium]|jgi:hypothetical protein